MSSHLFPGLFNGVGGHVERGENIFESARREVWEETSLDVRNLTLRGILHADEGECLPGAVVFVFVSDVTTKDVRPTEEGHLHWVRVDSLDQVALVPDLVGLLPRLAAPEPSPELFFISQTLPWAQAG